MKTNTMKKDRAALYLRVSKNEQNVEPQRIELREWAARHQVDVVVEIEDKITGKTWSRDGLDRLMELVRKGRVDVVACVKLDRLGRSLPHLAQLVHQLDTERCAIIATSQGIDTRKNSASGRLQLGVLMAVAEFERTLISERTVAGLEAAKRAGKKLGRPAAKLPKGWETTLKEWKRDGAKGVRGLARKLGGLSLSTVHALIKGTHPRQRE